MLSDVENAVKRVIEICHMRDVEFAESLTSGSSFPSFPSFCKLYLDKAVRSIWACLFAEFIEFFLGENSEFPKCQ